MQIDLKEYMQIECLLRLLPSTGASSPQSTLTFMSERDL